MTHKTLFIHAGGAKTGSSALQNFFEINATRLESLGFAYENRLHIEHDYEIGSANGMLLYETLSFANPTDNEIDSLVSSYFGQCDNAICTSEYYAEFHRHHWKRLLESSLRLGVKLKVIFYVRNVIPFFLSAYDQVIKRHGEWREFDEWVLEAIWQHVTALRKIAEELPKTSIQVLHFDQARTSLLRSFLDVLGIDASFEVNPNDQGRQVNRSLTNEERETLITVNKALGAAYSQEVSELLIYANPNIRGEPAPCHNTTTELLLDRYNTEVNWVNNTFFNGQDVVSVLPISPEKNLSKKPIIQLTQNCDIEKRVLAWTLEKLKTLKDETEQTIMNAVNIATQNTSEKSHPDIPVDFDVLAYLLINRDVLHAGANPIQHFIDHGKREGRIYKFINRQNSYDGQ
ncbi:MAG: hypothetical protein ACXW04_00055 [Methylobacter sp.]